ncbi:hypothetical protein N9948_01220 [bacterium]|nr:hypothetical protein [bacterium]
MFKSSVTKKKSPQQVIFVRASAKEINTGFERELTIFFEVPCEKCSPLTKSICRKCNGLGYKKENKKDKFKFEDINHQDQSFFYENYYEGIDLCIKVRVEAPQGFKIKGKSIESIENINIFKAILGGELEINTLKGKQKIILPEGKINDFTYILKGEGLFQGNHLIKLKVFLPKNLTDKHKEMLNNLVYEKNDQEGEK